MKKFIVGGTIFYMLADGERMQSGDMDYDCSYHYIIWPSNDFWRVKYRCSKEWESITDKVFDTENAAFNCAYDHFLNATKALYGR
ncbi:hypothetical protein B7D34_01045 (plasmid) [Klebsiella pneumoniae]|uniref:Uncharacterized protein n=3 Tax=Gammaproteobacteria TaxID=1236 RepID=A0A0U3BFJ9_CITFR|nr:MULTISPECIES: hypothetical protein [Gammaproteobacteria]ALT06332.1 hypothetical protein pKPC2_CF65_00029 [Citrobacter freundii]AVW74159.1 hypothetical protein B7D34_01045 [Klebsiella pneumoniae]AWY26812.1 hypothetical protein DQQ08_00205 [Klebsiella pneumoniae subsp. pneumoniae]MBW7733155.1 hypothetical protein [Enterobacter hormaechei]MCG5046787.1 hypothetical protein [Huaxiibacter chinensis]